MGGGQPRRTGADDGDPFRSARGLSAAGNTGTPSASLPVGEKAFDGADGHGLVELAPAAGLFAGVMADAAADARQGVVLADDVQGFVEAARPP